MVQAFSKVHNRLKMAVFLTLEGNIMSSVRFYRLILYSCVLCMYLLCFFSLSFFLCIMAHEQTLMSVNKCLNLVHISASTPPAASSVSVHQDNIY